MLDLHIHSTASDGSYTPTQIVQMAKKQGFSLIAVTDHDTMGGIKEAVEAGKKYGVQVIPGVEISAGVELEVHMLAYGISPDDPTMIAMLEDMSQARVERMLGIIENLRRLGIDITREEVEAKADGVIGRPHIARVLIEHGVVPDVRTAFREYIGVGAKAYQERRKMTVEQVIGNIRKAGGIPVLAHGGLLKLTETALNEWIDIMTRQGMMGLECYHNAHTPAMNAVLRSAAQRNDLLVTGGSDFHGLARPDIVLGSGLSSWSDCQVCRGRLLKALETNAKQTNS